MNEKWWLGYDLEQNEEIDEYKITFLNPCGPATSYPRHANVLRVSVEDVLTKVEMSNKNQRRPNANNIQQMFGALRCNPPAWVHIQMSGGCAARNYRYPKHVTQIVEKYCSFKKTYLL